MAGKTNIACCHMIDLSSPQPAAGIEAGGPRWRRSLRRVLRFVLVVAATLVAAYFLFPIR